MGREIFAQKRRNFWIPRTKRIFLAAKVASIECFFVTFCYLIFSFSIGRSLSWHMHPPNALCFAKHLLFLLPYKSIGMDTRHDILELARFLTELSVIDYFFVVYRPSVVAVAALLNSMEDTPGAVDAIGDFTRELKKVTSPSATSRDVVECRKRLRLLYAQGGYSRPTASAGSGSRDETISPVCVSYGCHVVPPAEEDFETA